MYDIPSGGVIFRHKIADSPVFTASIHEGTGGVLAVTARTGQVREIACALLLYFYACVRPWYMYMRQANNCVIRACTHMCLCTRCISLVQVSSACALLRIRVCTPSYESVFIMPHASLHYSHPRAYPHAQVLLLTLNMTNLVPYVTNVLRNSTLAMALAGRLGLGGADELYTSQFNEMLGRGDIEAAAKLAAASPGGILRTQATIARFQAMPTPEGGQPPALKYFAALMEAGKLNKVRDT